VLILTVIKGPDRGRRFELPDNEPQLIGRSSESLPLSDQTISRRHAELTPDGADWIINDLKSANGTFVNGVRVADPRPLRPGDQIRVGSSLFLFGVSSAESKSKGVRVARSGEIDFNVEAMVKSVDEPISIASQADKSQTDQLKVLYEVVKLMGSVFNRDELLERIMDVVFEHFRPDRGFVLLLEAPGQKPEPVVVRHRGEPDAQLPTPHDDEDTPDSSRITISKTIVQHVMKNGVGLLTGNAMNDSRLSGGDSIADYGIRSTLCVPIKFKDRFFGVIHLDSTIANNSFTEDHLRLLAAIGVQSGMALDHQRLVLGQIHKERLAATGETVASLSHSIKNIIQGIRGGADVVDLGLKKENVKVIRGGWDIVARNLERIYSLTTNMLQFAKRQKPEMEMTDLTKLMEEIVHLVQGQFDRKEVALLTDFDTKIPPIPLDPGGIHQAVLNLLTNALDAVEAEEGNVTVTTKWVPEQDRVLIEVADNGPGIDESLLPYLFQPFKSSKGMRGTGLGLTVTKKLIEEHGGKIDYTTAKDEGTTFTITLPTTASGVVTSDEIQLAEANHQPDQPEGEVTQRQMDQTVEQTSHINFDTQR
jgi:signal transduction histidine kinase